MSNEQSNIELSKRELQVLELVVTGASNQEIAHRLVISINTVKVHVRNIFEKLEVQSRTEATVRAIQDGLVTVSDGGTDIEETAEAPPTTPKTFLLEKKAPRKLRSWQQGYLLAALVLTALVAIWPLTSKESSQDVPELPVIFAQAPTPLPPPQNTNKSTRWVSHTAMPTSRAGLALIATNDHIFAIGGVKDNNQATRTVDIYQPSSKAWREGATKSTPVTNIGGVLWEDNIYIPGGCTQTGQAVDVLEIYDPKADSWRQGAALPEARCGYGLVSFGDHIYLFGGWDGQDFVDTIFVYDPNKDDWQSLDTTLPRSMGFMGAATLKDDIYIVGGYNGKQEFNETYAFNPTDNSWVDKEPLPEARGGLGLISSGQNLYAIGGGWEHALSNSEKYDAGEDKWTTFETPFDGQWRNLGLAAIDTTIYAAGGWDGATETYMDDLVSYQYLFQLFLPVSTFR